jgi:hypothetical protein
MLIFSASSGIWDFVGKFIKEGDFRFIVSVFSLFVCWGYLRLEEEWQHHKKINR